jgi:hypothetical protein
VAQLTVEQASGIGFGIPINRVKRLLQRQGLDLNLPAPLLSLGPSVDAHSKALRYRLPAGLEDISPVRLQVSSSYVPEGIAARIDRVASTWTPQQIESTLLTAGTFERFHASATARKSSASQNDRGLRTVSGHVTGSDATNGSEVKMEYTIVDLGHEKIVARYIGPGEAIALNRSILQTSLQELEAQPMLVEEITQVIPVTWAPSAQADGLGLPTPAKWVATAGMPMQCAGLSAPAAAQMMSPSGDFTVALRAAWRPDLTADIVPIARACSAQPGSQGDASYLSRVSWLGMDYQIEGVFARVPGKGFWQLELITPITKARLAADLFHAWVKVITQN